MTNHSESWSTGHARIAAVVAAASLVHAWAPGPLKAQQPRADEVCSSLTATPVHYSDDDGLHGDFTAQLCLSRGGARPFAEVVGRFGLRSTIVRHRLSEAEESALDEPRTREAMCAGDTTRVPSPVAQLIHELNRVVRRTWQSCRATWTDGVRISFEYDTEGRRLVVVVSSYEATQSLDVRLRTQGSPECARALTSSIRIRASEAEERGCSAPQSLLVAATVGNVQRVARFAARAPSQRSGSNCSIGASPDVHLRRLREEPGYAPCLARAASRNCEPSDIHCLRQQQANRNLVLAAEQYHTAVRRCRQRGIRSDQNCTEADQSFPNLRIALMQFGDSRAGSRGF